MAVPRPQGYSLAELEVRHILPSQVIFLTQVTSKFGHLLTLQLVHYGREAVFTGMTQLGSGVELWFQTIRQEHHLFFYTIFMEHLSSVRAHGHLPSCAFMLLYSYSLSQALFSR